jgi:hypothetical protein
VKFDVEFVPGFGLAIGYDWMTGGIAILIGCVNVVVWR